MLSKNVKNKKVLLNWYFSMKKGERFWDRNSAIYPKGMADMEKIYDFLIIINLYVDF